MSGKRVIAFIAAGVLLIATITFVLYLLTRQIDNGGDDAPRFNAKIGLQVDTLTLRHAELVEASSTERLSR